MPRTLIINSDNAVDSTPNTYEFEFKGPIQFKSTSMIAVAALSIPYSWFNITPVNNNNSFSYAIKGSVFNVNLPSGFYDVTAINAYLQFVLIQNGHYLQSVNSLGVVANWYPFSITTNGTFYALQFICNAIPAALPVGWLNPGNVFYNTITFTQPTAPQLIVPDTKIQAFFGLFHGSFPTTSTTTVTFNQLSQYCPQVTPVSSVILRCNLVNNDFTNPPDALFTFTPSNTGFGSNIVSNVSTPVYVSVNPGTYQRLTVTLVDQNYNTLYLNDDNICLQLIIVD